MPAYQFLSYAPLDNAVTASAMLAGVALQAALAECLTRDGLAGWTAETRA